MATASTGLQVFDSTLQKTNLWLKEVMAELGWDDRHAAYLAVRSVLHALRDRLTHAEGLERSLAGLGSFSRRHSN